MTSTDTQLARRGAQDMEAAQPRALTWEMIEDLTGYDQAQIALVARTVAQGAPMQELVVFLHACKTLDLDPLLRQAYWIRRKSRELVNGQWQDVYKGTLQVGIDGFRAIAERSGAYAGSEPPRFLGQIEVSGKDGKFIAPERAQVVVWKIVQGHKAAFTGEANWTEFYPGDGPVGQMYRKMPRHMLAKDAEAQALRKAFPALLSAVQQSSAIGEDVALGDLPEVAAPPRIVEQPQPARPRADASTYDRTVGAEYRAQDSGWTPAVAVESVRHDPDQTAPERRQEFESDVDDEIAALADALMANKDLLKRAQAAGKKGLGKHTADPSWAIERVLSANRELEALVPDEAPTSVDADSQQVAF